jgi:hypothetical protein
MLMGVLQELYEAIPKKSSKTSKARQIPRHHARQMRNRVPKSRVRKIKTRKTMTKRRVDGRREHPPKKRKKKGRGQTRNSDGKQTPLPA